MDPEWLMRQIVRGLAALESIAESLEILADDDEDDDAPSAIS